jgi:hypothetical protein
MLTDIHVNSCAEVCGLVPECDSLLITTPNAGNPTE